LGSSGSYNFVNRPSVPCYPCIWAVKRAPRDERRSDGPVAAHEPRARRRPSAPRMLPQSRSIHARAPPSRFDPAPGGCHPSQPRRRRKHQLQKDGRTGLTVRLLWPGDDRLWTGVVLGYHRGQRKYDVLFADAPGPGWLVFLDSGRIDRNRVYEVLDRRVLDDSWGDSQPAKACGLINLGNTCVPAEALACTHAAAQHRASVCPRGAQHHARAQCARRASEYLSAALATAR
jgi:hypothetical protein